MKKNILIIINGGLPLPSIKGGAVETLINHYLNKNEEEEKYNFDVISNYEYGVEKLISKYKFTNFYYINTKKIKYKIGRFLRAILRNILMLKIDNQFIIETKKMLNRNKKKYDLIIVENSISLVSSMNKIFPGKVVLHLHNDWINNESKNSYEIFYNCKRIYTVSDFLKARCMTCNEKSDKVVTILNGIDRKKLIAQNTFNNRKHIRNNYNLTENDLVFLFTGRVCDDKGVFELIEAFNFLCKKYNNIKLMIVGASFYSANKKTKYIKKLINLSSTNKNKIIFTGYVKHDDIGKIYCASDIQVIPSKIDDSCPLTVMEGMTMGLPQIVTDSGGIPEEVKDTKTIIISRKNLTQNLIIAMEKLIQSKSLRDEMSKVALKKSKEFSIEKFTRKIFTYIDEDLNDSIK